MARQGKMHSSPFHVETSAYKHAIEHENDNYPIQQAPIECGYRKASTNSCYLWNSGHKYCKAYKCHFYKKVDFDSRVCKNCAYYSKACAHPRKPEKAKIEQNAAVYCSYYVSEIDKEKYRSIQTTIERLKLTADLERSRKSIRSWKKYIRQAQRKLRFGTLDPENSAYLNEKIRKRESLILDTSERVVDIEHRLEQLGGPLFEWPQKPKR